MHKDTIDIRGVQIHPEFLSLAEQISLYKSLKDIIRMAPMFSPITPYGKPMSVKMTSAGKYGWYSDKSGYRYIKHHPNGLPWPRIPNSIMSIWKYFVGNQRDPDCCLINYYGKNCRMGQHRDCDEQDYSWPVISVSLGDQARFRIGNRQRGGKTKSVLLKSGDIVILGGEARLIYHGIDRVYFNSSALLEEQGRFNLTLRVVD